MLCLNVFQKNVKNGQNSLHLAKITFKKPSKINGLRLFANPD